MKTYEFCIDYYEDVFKWCKNSLNENEYEFKWDTDWTMLILIEEGFPESMFMLKFGHLELYKE